MACNRKFALYCVDSSRAFWVAEYVPATNSAHVLGRFISRANALNCINNVAQAALNYVLPETNKIADRFIGPETEG